MKRVDGRDQFEYREIQIETGVSKKAEGSAKVKLGNTQVVAGVKLQTGEPYPQEPEKGTLIVNAELLPLASPSFEAGPPGPKAVEIARVVDRGIREAKAINLEELCIEPEEKVWTVFVDLSILDHDGNLIDASALAAIKALLSSHLVKYEDEKIVREEAGPLPVKEKPVACTFGKVNDKIVLDPSLEEEDQMDCRLTVTTDQKGRVVSLQKGKAGAFQKEEIFKLVNLAKEKGEELRKLL